MDTVKEIYKENEISKDKVSRPIVKVQAERFEQGIDSILGNIDFDSPEYYLREALRKNMWQFSAAKNYNDCVRINNLLLDENGKLRSWSDFLFEAKKVIGDSTRYLKTEYNTIIASAQMSRLWFEIQRDKSIFPFVQFLVVQDDHTSEICSPLHNLIFSVDDPVLAYYFPPNHFNCRTTVKKLRHGVPSKDYTLPEIPEAFKNNVADTGKIFTDENRYIASTPNDVLDIASQMFFEDQREKRYKDFDFKEIDIDSKNGLLQVAENIKRFGQEKHEWENNLEVLKILVKNDYKYRMLPVVEDGMTNPDALNLDTNEYSDIKYATSTNGKNILQSAMKQGSRQKVSELIIYFKEKPNSYRQVYEALKMSIKQNRNKNVKHIVIVYPDQSVKEYSIDRIKKKL